MLHEASRANRNCIVNTASLMIRVNLRKAMDAYWRRTGVRLTYAVLSKRTSISADTLQSIAARPNYNTRLSTIDSLCRALECSPGDLLEMTKSKGLPREN